MSDEENISRYIKYSSTFEKFTENLAESKKTKAKLNKEFRNKLKKKHKLLRRVLNQYLIKDLSKIVYDYLFVPVKFINIYRGDIYAEYGNILYFTIDNSLISISFTSEMSFPSLHIDYYIHIKNCDKKDVKTCDNISKYDYTLDYYYKNIDFYNELNNKQFYDFITYIMFSLPNQINKHMIKDYNNLIIKND